jgi:hypothetical protein
MARVVPTFGAHGHLVEAKRRGEQPTLCTIWPGLVAHVIEFDGIV